MNNLKPKNHSYTYINNGRNYFDNLIIYLMKKKNETIKVKYIFLVLKL